GVFHRHLARARTAPCRRRSDPARGMAAARHADGGVRRGQRRAREGVRWHGARQHPGCAGSCRPGDDDGPVVDRAVAVHRARATAVRPVARAVHDRARLGRRCLARDNALGVAERRGVRGRGRDGRAAAVVRGELLWPGVLLTALAWTALAITELLTSGTMFGRVSLSWRLSAGAAFAMLAPALVFAQLTIHNAAALIFPAWVPLGYQ